MPYIDPIDRNILIPHIKKLAGAVSLDPTLRPGQVNYAITALVRTIYGDKLRYNEWNEIMGVLSGVDKEMYRVNVAPYEDEKIFENGKVNPL